MCDVYDTTAHWTNNVNRNCQIGVGLHQQAPGGARAPVPPQLVTPVSESKQFGCVLLFCSSLQTYVDMHIQGRMQGGG